MNRTTAIELLIRGKSERSARLRRAHLARFKPSSMAQVNEMQTNPTVDEFKFVSTILQIKHFQALIGVQQRLQGMPVADPFVIACAKIKLGTVVTEEGWQRPSDKLSPKPNAAKIPNVCAHFEVCCVDREEFMQQRGWAF